MSMETITSAVQEIELLRFLINRKEYAIDVKKVREILKIDRISSVPDSKEEISGIALVRGSVVTVVDLKYVLEKRHIDGNTEGMTLLCELKGMKIAFQVDEVLGIHRVKETEVIPPDSILNTDLVAGNINFENTIVMLLDIEKIASDCIAC